MRFVSIASGSSGNCIYVGSDRTNLLVDAGISNKRIEQGLNEIGIKGSELSGILITHEHSDHTRGLGVLARKYGVPVYSTRETLEEIAGMKSLGEYPKELLKPIAPDGDFTVGDLTVKPFRVDHDACLLYTSSRLGDICGQIFKQILKLRIVRCDCHVGGVGIRGPVVQDGGIDAVGAYQADAVDDDAGCPCSRSHGIGIRAGGGLSVGKHDHDPGVGRA